MAAAEADSALSEIYERLARASADGAVPSLARRSPQNSAWRSSAEPRHRGDHPGGPLTFGIDSLIGAAVG